MSFDSPNAERRLRNTARLFHQSVWLLFVIAAGLMIIVRRSVPARTGSLWMILGCAVLAFALSFALRDVVRKVGHRNTENQIVRDVKNFLEREPDPPAPQPALAPAVSEAVSPVGYAFVPSGSADFVTLKGAGAYSPSAADPVVFDVFPPRPPVDAKPEFSTALLAAEPDAGPASRAS